MIEDHQENLPQGDADFGETNSEFTNRTFPLIKSENPVTFFRGQLIGCYAAWAQKYLQKDLVTLSEIEIEAFRKEIKDLDAIGKKIIGRKDVETNKLDSYFAGVQIDIDRFMGANGVQNNEEIELPDGFDENIFENVLHDVKNPHNNINMFVDVLEKSLEKGVPVEKIAEGLRGQIEIIQKVTQEFYEKARGEEEEDKSEVIDMRYLFNIFENVKASFFDTRPLLGVDFLFDNSIVKEKEYKDLLVKLPPDLLEGLLLNVLTNIEKEKELINENPELKKIQVQFKVYYEYREEYDELAIIFEDNCRGFHQDFLEAQGFIRNVSDHEDGEGVGMVDYQERAMKHGAFFELTNYDVGDIEGHKGARLKLVIPLHKEG